MFLRSNLDAETQPRSDAKVYFPVWYGEVRFSMMGRDGEAGGFTGDLEKVLFAPCRRILLLPLRKDAAGFSQGLMSLNSARLLKAGARSMGNVSPRRKGAVSSIGWDDNNQQPVRVFTLVFSGRWCAVTEFRRRTSRCVLIDMPLLRFRQGSSDVQRAVYVHAALSCVRY